MAMNWLDFPGKISSASKSNGSEVVGQSNGVYALSPETIPILACPSRLLSWTTTIPALIRPMPLMENSLSGLIKFQSLESCGSRNEKKHISKIVYGIILFKYEKRNYVIDVHYVLHIYFLSLIVFSIVDLKFSLFQSW